MDKGEGRCLSKGSGRRHKALDTMVHNHSLPGVRGLEVAVRLGTALGRAHRPAPFSEGNGSSMKVLDWE